MLYIIYWFRERRFKRKIELILNYAKDYCELTKKIYVLGMVSGNDEETKHITKGDITKTLDSV